MSVKEDLNKLITDVKLNQFKNNAGKDIVKNIEKELVEAMKPVLRDLASSVGQSVRQAISQVQVSTPNVTLNPTFTVPDIEVPEAKVTVSVPPIKIPDIKMPDEMNIKGWVGLMGVSLEKPLPVQIRNGDGSPFSFENLNVFGGGSGGMRHVIVDNFSQIGGSGGLTDTELRATPVPVSQVSGYSDSVNVVTTVGLTNTELRATTVDVKQVSGSVDSVVVNDVLVTVGVNQVSGANWSVSATQVTSPWVVSATDLDVRDLVNTSDSVRVYQLSGASWSVEASLAASSTVNVNGATNSTISVGPVLHDAVDDGAAPQKVGGTAMQANPTAVAGGDIVRFVADDIGRQLTRPVQVRDLIATAFVTLTDSSEDTLLAGVSATFLDLIYVMAANESDAAINLAFRTGTAGSTMFELEVPAQGTVGVSLQVPIPASEVAQAWTVQNTGSDHSNTTVNISALFSKEI